MVLGHFLLDVGFCNRITNTKKINGEVMLILLYPISVFQKVIIIYLYLGLVRCSERPTIGPCSLIALWGVLSKSN